MENKTIDRTRGVYPFMPIKLEHERIRQPETLQITDDETGLETIIIYYGLPDPL